MSVNDSCGRNDAAARYPVRINAYCARLAKHSQAVRAMYEPDAREVAPDGLLPDGLGESARMPVGRLMRRFEDRALLLCTSECFAHCRFCFRKRQWRDNAQSFSITDDELDEACGYLDTNREISETLLSGGDVLTLTDERLLFIARRVRASGNVTCVRICSRAPAVEPDRITRSLAKKMSEIEGLWFVTHFDHPDELTAEAREACRTLVSAGIPVLNQSVLLAGVNDSPETLSTLFKTLVSWRVKPHYLFHIDPVEGVGHFATGVEKGLEIMGALRTKLSSIATPAFSLDLPDGGGKILLSPDSPDVIGVYYSRVLNRYMKHPLAALPKK